MEVVSASQKEAEPPTWANAFHNPSVAAAMKTQISDSSQAEARDTLRVVRFAPPYSDRYQPTTPSPK